jgi:polysaccharide biosynthesis/export protein
MVNLCKVAELILCVGMAASMAEAASPQEGAPVRLPSRAAADLVKDNLDRVAATPEQILDILNKDAGLMVELKELLAEDAAMYGQLLEESDLSDTAIAERLRQDLHVRALATKLLRRYGYLIPRLNPDSDMAAKHALDLRERSQQLERTREWRDASREEPSLAGTSTCDLSVSQACAEPRVAPNRGTESPERLLPEKKSATGPIQQTANQELDALRPEFETPALELTQFPVESTPAENLLNSTLAMNPSPDAIRSGLSLAGKPEEARMETLAASEKGITPPIKRSSREEFLPSTNREAAEFEPTHLNRKPIPYAEVPSLADLYVQAASPNQKPKQFGIDVFRRGEPNPDILPMDLPVGPDYVVGPGDSLSLNLWGGVSQQLVRVVDREGRVALPEVGAVLVSGRTLGDVQDEIQQALRTQFRHISADVSLLRLRTVRVYVVGEVVSPGGYDISSLSTPLNALFVAGGITPLGSLRRLEHYRGKQLIEQVDAYDLLLHGIRGDLKRLENGDSLRVPPVGPSVTIDGMVRRPAIYELNREKNLNQLVELAGGLLPAAALGHVEVQRLEAHEKHTMLSVEINGATDKESLRTQLEKFVIQDGDEVHIFPIAPYNTGVVYLEGHVLRPGRYSYKLGMRLTDLIKSYNDLLPEPSGSYAEIVHIAPPDFRPVVESFDLEAALGNVENAPNLAPLDTIRVFGKYEFERTPEVLVTGDVRSPGRYRMTGQEHLRDAVYQAGGLMSDAWLDTAQLFREQPDGGSRVLSIDLRSALQGTPSDNLLLTPGDRILIHRQPLKVDLPSVTVEGQVARPGRYPLSTNMQLSDLIRSAGGFLRGANLNSADLTHYPTGDKQVSPSGSHTVNLTAALRGDVDSGIPLHDGDVLTISPQKGWKDIGATMTLRGEVARPGTYGIQPGERLSSVLRRAGGLLPSAYPQAAVFERVSVRETQQRSRQELIQRLEQESVTVKTSLNTSETEQAALQQAAAQQKERVLEALRKAPISGRLVVHLQTGRKDFAGSADDIELRPADILDIPKRPGFVLIVGQVYNSNAIIFVPHKNGRWYLARAGGATQLANKKAIFILRANGEVTSGSGSSWNGGALASTIGPGDTIVVPEKAVLGAGNSWKNVVSIAQIAQGAALAAAIAIP